MPTNSTLKEEAPPGEPAPSLEICLFGPLTVRCGGKPLAKMRTRKEQWLLALLALHSTTALDRSYLAGVLWPEAEETLSLQYLRRSLVLLRKSLGSEAQRLHSPTPRTLGIDLSGDAVCDVLLFDRARTRNDEASLTEASEAYRGPLLQGCIEEWAQAERESRQRAVVAVLQALAERLRTRGALPAATAQLQRALEIDPLCETALRTLMSVLADQGRHAAAAEAFHAFRTRLHRDMNAVPDPETIRLSRQLNEKTRAEGESVRAAVERQPGYLPSAIAPLIGRVAERETVIRLLQTHRLLTLTGPGGVGKTRLTLSVAEHIREDFPDGAWFVDLSSLQEASLIAMVVLSALGGSELANGSHSHALEQHLQAKRLLLILDNCEYLTEACCRLAQTLLRRCPELRILATSREPLRAPAETVWPVPGMATADAVQLFTDRATQSRPSFTLNSGNAEAVDRICARLDRMPLAIEIVAARTRGISATQIAGDLDDVFRVLNQTGGHVDLRHQTLRATLDWSHGMLSAGEQSLFKRLSVFAGGWTRAAAEAVCADEMVPAAAMPDLLLGLVEKSLIEYAENEPDEGRYRFLETTRAYAAERLPVNEQAILSARHAEHFARLAEGLPQIQGERGEHTLINRLERELSNIRAALSWCRSSCAAGQALRLAGSLWKFWWVRGHLTEGRQQIGAALAIACPEPIAPLSRIIACKGSGILAYFQHDFETARQLYEEGLALAQSCRESGETGSLFLNLGLLYTAMDDFEIGRQYIEQALSVFSEVNFGLGVAKCRASLGEILEHEGDLNGARQLFQETLTYFESVEDLYNVGGSCLDIARIIRKQRLKNLAENADTHSDELAWLRTGLKTYQSGGHGMRVADCLDEMAWVFTAEQRFDTATELLAASGKSRESVDCVTPDTLETVAESLEKARAALGTAEFNAAWARGRALTMDEAVALALQEEAKMSHFRS